MGFVQDVAKDAYARAVLKPLADLLKREAKADLEKVTGNPMMMDRMPFNNPYPMARTKPGSAGGVNYDTLRRFSVQYDVARAAINRRKRQLNGLAWDIVAAEKDDETDYNADAKILKKQFKHIGGYKVRFREFIDKLTEDLLVLDAMAIYKRPTMGGELYSLEPVDASTIVLSLDESGGTPMPPDIAYRQFIRGKEEATFTADEMYYEMMNPRSNTPYGLAPLESLVLGVSAALKSEIYNVHLLTEGNIPEGFFSVPENWKPDQIKEFQKLWDAALSGDTRATSKLRFVPPGSYQPAVKPEDMRYKELQEWLMLKTCMLFEIPPNELGFTMNVNKANGEVQHDIGVDTGLRPLAEFFQEILTDVVQEDLGYENLAFKYTGLDITDEKRDAEIAAIKINSGQTTVDEVRKGRGQKPLGVDKPFVIGTPTFIDADSMKQRAAAADALIGMGKDDGSNDGKGDANPVDNSGKTTDDTVIADPKAEKSAVDTHVQLVSEMRTFRKYAINRIKDGKSLRKFQSEVLPLNVVEEMNTRLSTAAKADDVKEIFKEYMADYQVNFLAETINLRKSIGHIINE